MINPQKEKSSKTIRLLITTQAVDLDDPVLGFFHRWIEELARHCESVSVVCLKEGRHQLPSNVRVHSLGKENKKLKTKNKKIFERIRYIARFYRYIWSMRRAYDAVFVHMNQEYVLLGGIWWRLWSRRIVLWRNHKMGSFATRVAAAIAHIVCYTSPAAYVAHYKNAVQMPIGIDTRVFAPGAQKPAPGSILFLGRLDPVKKPEIFLDALSQLAGEGCEFKASIYGSPTYPDAPYVPPLRQKMDVLASRGVLRVHGAVANDQTPALYASHAIYVNLTPSGSFDKTIGEAMACGAVVVAANAALQGTLPDKLIIEADSVPAAAEGIRHALALGDSERETISQTSRAYIIREHSLVLLADKLMRIMTL